MTDVLARGKHLFIQTTNNLAIQSHMGMKGRWRAYVPFAATRPLSQIAEVRGAALVLRTHRALAVLKSPSQLRLMRADQIRSHFGAGRLGPDLLDPNLDKNVCIQKVVRNLQASPDPIGVALLDQRLVAGVGNVFKSELLFLNGMNPFCQADAFTPNS